MSRRAARIVAVALAFAAAGLALALALAADEQAMDQRLKEVDPLLRELEKTSRQFHNVPREHGQFLRMLVEMSGAKNALEVGTSNGYSGIWIGLGLEKTGGKLTTIEIVPEIAAKARENFKKAGMDDIITCITGDALKVIPTLDEEFDFVFLDAVKSDYWRYFELVRPKLKDGAVLAAHNAVSMRRAMSKYFEIVQNSPDMVTTVVAIEPRDGIAVTYVRKVPEK